VGAFVAVIWYEKALPAVPFAVLPLVITGAGTAMASVKVALPVPPPLVALRVTVDVPAPVAVPEINPVPLFTVMPAGNPAAA